MKIYDCFTFFNELDLLELRLKLLNDYVDFFVIAESNLTHSGQPKPLHFEANKDRYIQWAHKIIYIPLSQSAEGMVFEKNLTAYTPQSSAWKLENEQRNALSSIHRLADEDLVLVSDLDEIPNPKFIRKMNVTNGPVALSLLFHYYFLNCQNTGRDRWWNGTIAASGKQFLEATPQGLRDKRNEYPIIKKAGWHFSYLGGLESIKYKIRSFAHTEFNKDEYLQDEFILKALQEGHDIFKRPDVMYQFMPLYYYPVFLQGVMKQYPAFINQKIKGNPMERLLYKIKNIFS